MKTKICITCRVPKKLTEFHRDVSTRDRHYPRCKVCVSKRNSRWWRKHHPKPTPGMLCGKLIRYGWMHKRAPCLRLAGHASRCSPDLTGLVFGDMRVISQGTPSRMRNGSIKRRTWRCADQYGDIHPNVATASILNGQFRGLNRPKGSGTIDKNGYRLVSTNGRPQLEHRVIMSKLLGRPLRDDETIHHGPKGRACNDPNNLSIRLVGKHPAGHDESELAEWLRSLGWTVTPPRRIQS